MPAKNQEKGKRSSNHKGRSNSSESDSTQTKSMSSLPEAFTKEPPELNIYWGSYIQDEFEYFYRQDLSSTQIANMITRICQRRSITVLDYFNIAPKSVFAHFTMDFFKVWSPGSKTRQITQYFSSKFPNTTLTKMVTYGETNQPFQLLLMLLIDSFWEIVKLQNYNPQLSGKLLQYLQYLGTGNRALLYPYIYSSLTKQQLPEFSELLVQHGTPSVKPMRQIKCILDMKINEVILFLIDEDYEQYIDVLEKLLAKHSNSTLTQALIKYSESFEKEKKSQKSGQPQQMPDNYLLRLIDHFLGLIAVNDNKISRQRYLLCILLILLNLPKSHKDLNSKVHKKVIPLVIERVIKYSMTSQYQIIPILLKYKELFQLGQMKLEERHFFIFMDGILSITDIIASEMPKPQERSSVQNFIFSKSQDVVSFLIGETKIFHNELYLKCNRFPRLQQTMRAKFTPLRKQLYHTNKRQVIEKLIYLLKEELASESGNLFRVYMVLKRLKPCLQQQIEARQQFVQLLKPLTNYIRKVQLISQEQYQFKSADRVVLRIFELISCICCIIDYHSEDSTPLPMSSMYADNYILDDFRSILPSLKQLRGENGLEKWIEKYVWKHQNYFSLSCLNNFIQLEKIKSRSPVLLIQHQQYVYKVVNDANMENNTQKMKTTFTFYLSIASNSCLSIVLTPLYLFWLIKSQRESKALAAFLDSIFRDYVLPKKFPNLQALGCLHSLQIIQMLAEGDAVRQKAFQRTLDLIDHHTISLCFEQYKLPKQALFYEQKTNKWSPQCQVPDSTLGRCYNLTKAIESESIPYSLEQIKTKFKVKQTNKDGGKQHRQIGKKHESQKSYMPLLKQVISIGQNHMRQEEKLPLENYFHFHECFTELIDEFPWLNTLEQMESQNEVMRLQMIIWHYSRMIRALVNNCEIEYDTQALNCFQMQMAEPEYLLIMMYRMVSSFLRESKVNWHKTLLLEFIHKWNSKILQTNVEDPNPHYNAPQFCNFIHTSLINQYFDTGDFKNAQRLIRTNCNEIQLIFSEGKYPEVLSKFNSLIKEDKGELRSQFLGCLDYYLLAMLKHTFINEKAKNILDVLKRIKIRQLRQEELECEELSHLCSILNILFLYNQLTDEDSKVLLRLVYKWIVFCIEREYQEEGSLLTSYFLRFYIQRVRRELKEDENNAGYQEWLNKENSKDKTVDIFSLIAHSPGYFKEGARICIEEISERMPSTTKVIQKILLNIALKSPNDSIWWVVMLKKYTFGRTKDDSLSLWNRDDKEKENVGHCLYKEIQKKVDSNILTFLQGLYAMFQAEHKKVDEALTKKTKVFVSPEKGGSKVILLDAPVEIPFVQPLQITKFGNIEPLGSSKCLTRKIKVELADGSSKTIILKAEYKSTNHGNESKMVHILHKVLPANLKVSYEVIQLSKYFIMVEFLEGYQTLKKVRDTNETTANEGIRFDAYQIQKNDNPDGGAYLKQTFWMMYNGLSPVLPKISFSKYSAAQWWDFTRNYTKTVAIWSITCYVLGLGDRHSQNILINTENGKIAHVDFQCSMDIGKSLGYPEFIPFRFTPNIEAPLGVLRGYGSFLRCCMEQMRTMQVQRQQIINKVIFMKLRPDRTLREIVVDMLSRMNIHIKGENPKPILQVVVENINMARNPSVLQNMYKGWDPVF